MFPARGTQFTTRSRYIQCHFLEVWRRVHSFTRQLRDALQTAHRFGLQATKSARQLNCRAPGHPASFALNALAPNQVRHHTSLPLPAFSAPSMFSVAAHAPRPDARPELTGWAVPSSAIWRRTGLHASLTCRQVRKLPSSAYFHPTSIPPLPPWWSCNFCCTTAVLCAHCPWRLPTSPQEAAGDICGVPCHKKQLAASQNEGWHPRRDPAHLGG